MQIKNGKRLEKPRFQQVQILEFDERPIEIDF
jgi:hypothetical protein